MRRYDEGVAALETRRACDWCYDKKLVTLDESVSVRDALATMHEARRVRVVYSTDGALLGVLDTPDAVRELRASADMGSSARRVLRQCTVAGPSVSVAEICKHLCAGMRYIATCDPRGGHQIVSQRAVAVPQAHAARDDEGSRACSPARARARPRPHPPPARGAELRERRERAPRFEPMAAYGISSVPVVGASGAACAVISATDVLYARDDAGLLDADVLDYLCAARADARVARAVHTIVPH